ncbi:MAG TPA: polysaccharide deacetylase family protein [Ohtaekwangia sp.]
MRLVVVACLILISADVYSCKCGSSSLEIESKASQAIFHGLVTSVYGDTYQVKVLHLWKGEIKTGVVQLIQKRTSCETRLFVPGVEYVFFLSNTVHTDAISNCSRTAEYNSATADRAMLNKMFTPEYAPTKFVCFTIDDLPVVSYGITDSVYQQNLTSRLIASLRKNNIPAVGFVNEYKAFDAAGHQKEIHFQVEMMKQWLDNGLELGNHTFSHPDYNLVNFKTFSEDILRGETITRRLLKAKGKELRYFRHPFLHMGNSQAKADSLNQFLEQHGYTIAPVTIDNDDYLFALAYKRASVKGDKAQMQQIGKDYVDYMEKKVQYFEQQASRFFGRDIKHILLLHASLLNADYTDALADMFRKNNYGFISLEEALTDRAYETTITAFGNWGISWIHRWVLSSGRDRSFFNGEPEVPEYITKLAQ